MSYRKIIHTYILLAFINIPPWNQEYVNYIDQQTGKTITNNYTAIITINKAFANQ